MFLVLAGLYVGYQVLGRWLRFFLFDRFETANGEYFGPKLTTPGEFVYQILTSLLPILAWGTLIYFCLTRKRWLTHCTFAFLLLVGGFVFLEADMHWYTFSKRHLGMAEVLGFLYKVDPTNDIGLSAGDFERFYAAIFQHGAVLAGLVLLASLLYWLRGWPPLSLVARFLSWLGERAPWRWLGSKRALALVAGLVLLDVVLVRYWQETKDPEDIGDNRRDNAPAFSTWGELVGANPLRFRFLDDWCENLTTRFSDRYHDLEAANACLTELDASAPTPMPTSEPTKGIHVQGRAQFPRDSVLVIAVESLNAGVFAETDLPFLGEFSKKCLRLKKHFSAGNGTHYGLLGLLYGKPITFYRGPQEQPLCCPYLELFGDKKYDTRCISTRLFTDRGNYRGGYHWLGHYVDGWTRSQALRDKHICRTDSDWEIVPEFHNECSNPGPRFSFLFYLCTHYRYWHQPEYCAYQPEVDYDFTYNRPDLARFRPEIVNRYKNCLLELDAWIKEILKKVDLDRTIVVITGDHGEELVERGRIGHCMTLNVYQTQVPCLIYIPGVPPQDVEFVTSHSDILPSVAEALGWKKDRPAGLGQSIFTPVPFRYAVVAQQNWQERPTRWMILTEDRKAIVDETSRNQLEISQLLDWDGRRLNFQDEPQLWHNNFRVIRKLEAELSR
jgi:hypothetical protein